MIMARWCMWCNSVIAIYIWMVMRPFISVKTFRMVYRFFTSTSFFSCLFCFFTAIISISTPIGLVTLSFDSLSASVLFFINLTLTEIIPTTATVTIIAKPTGATIPNTVAAELPIVLIDILEVKAIVPPPAIANSHMSPFLSTRITGLLSQYA